jgi:class 3 adenylate cyclase
MAKKTRYRLYVWLTIFSGAVLAGVLAFTSIKTLQADKRFIRMVLEENKTFLANTLRFGHSMMMRMGEGGQYDELIDMALKSRFIRYLALLNDEGKVVARSNPPKGLRVPEAYAVNALKDGAVLRDTGNLLMVSYKAEDIHPSGAGMTGSMSSRMEGMSRMSSGFGDHRPISWFVVALDVSGFREHYREALVQTIVMGAGFLLFGILVISFFGFVQRYELAHLSLQRLQKIKTVLANFVPETAKKIIEQDPDRAVLDKYIQDATVLFLDIEGFTSLVQTHPQEQVNRTIETYFSCFYDWIQKSRGDINETAGDGMMVIFLDPDPLRHARNAVDAARQLQERCLQMQAAEAERIPIKVNIGISSGEVYLGSTKMRSTLGDRWTFTASGQVTILAARLSQYARGGQILLAEETAKRLDPDYPMVPLGRVELKNLADSGDVFQLKLRFMDSRPNSAGMTTSNQP